MCVGVKEELANTPHNRELICLVNVRRTTSSLQDIAVMIQHVVEISFQAIGSMATTSQREIINLTGVKER